MVGIIVDGFVYRLLNNGLMEHAKLPEKLPDKLEFGSQFSPEERNMSGGEDAIVRSYLMALFPAFPEDRLGMPQDSTNKPRQEEQNPMAPAGSHDRR